MNRNSFVYEVLNKIVIKKIYILTFEKPKFVINFNFDLYPSINLFDITLGAGIYFLKFPTYLLNQILTFLGINVFI